MRSVGGGTCPFPGTLDKAGDGVVFIAGTVPLVAGTGSAVGSLTAGAGPAPFVPPAIGAP